MDSILARVGWDDLTPELLHQRRGTTLYRAEGIALKITRGLMAGREGTVLRLLGSDFHLGHGWEAEYGTDEGRSWLLTRWIDGASLGRELESARWEGENSAARARVFAAAGRAARAVADLHAMGWAHADLQPDHFLFEGDVTHLIDLACAQGPVEVPFYPHRGGLAHTTAPEIAEAILATDGHVTATFEADVWALGACLWWAWTGTTPIAYPAGASSRVEQMTAIARLRRTPATARPWPFPEFEDLVASCLAPDPADRPTAKELAARLA